MITIPQVKIFEFTIQRNINTSRIEDEINNFLEVAVREVIDIKVNVAQIHTHNNAGDNTHKIIYTIIYK